VNLHKGCRVEMSSALISMPPAVDVQSRPSISSRKYKLVIVLPVMLIVTYWSSNASTIVFLNKMLRKVAPPLKVYMIVLLLMGEKITLFLSFLNIMLNWFYFRKNMFMGPHTFCKKKIAKSMCVRIIEFALSTIFIFYFGIVGIVWYLLFFILFSIHCIKYTNRYKCHKMLFF
jgi:hypothetical protein